MKRILFLLMVVSFGLSSCEKNNSDVPSPTEQTVFMYLPWSTNLTSDFRKNISDFESVVAKDILRNERVLVFFATSPTEATLFELKYAKGKCVQETLKYYTTSTFTTADGITSLLNDVKSNAPANRYAMIIGCHGLGWIPVSATTKSLRAQERMHWEYEGGIPTRYFGGLSSEYQTNITDLAEGISRAGMRMEYVLFDDCYMSSIEVAYDLKEVADYLIASPVEVMAHGMPYAEIGKYLIGEVDYYKVCSGFHAFYENYKDPYGAIALTKCSELDNLAAVMKHINQSFSFDYVRLGEVQRLDGYDPAIFFDYGDYVNKLCDDPALLSAFEEQLERAVPSKYRMHTEYYYSGGLPGLGEGEIKKYSGVTISDPSLSSKALAKTETAWYKATH